MYTKLMNRPLGMIGKDDCGREVNGQSVQAQPKNKGCIYPPHHAEAYRTRYQVNYDVSQQIPIPQNSLLIHYFENRRGLALNVRTI